MMSQGKVQKIRRNTVQTDVHTLQISCTIYKTITCELSEENQKEKTLNSGIYYEWTKFV